MPLWLPRKPLWILAKAAPSESRSRERSPFTLGQHARQQGAIQPHGGEQVQVQLLLPLLFTQGRKAACRGGRVAHEAAGSWGNLQAVNALIGQFDMVKQLYRAAGEIAGLGGGNHHLVAILRDLGGRDVVLELTAGAAQPITNGGNALVGLPFILHAGIGGKTAQKETFHPTEHADDARA